MMHYQHQARKMFGYVFDDLETIATGIVRPDQFTAVFAAAPSTICCFSSVLVRFTVNRDSDEESSGHAWVRWVVEIKIWTDSGCQ